MKVYLGADHRGFHLKEELKKFLSEQQISFEDLGAHHFKPQDDYVDYANAVAGKVANDLKFDPQTRGVVICGSGVGVDVVANKIDGIRCALGFSEKEIMAARNDDDINVLALPADLIDISLAKKLITKFLKTPFAHKKRYERRIEKIKEIENTN